MRFSVHAPASSANLGPGFDALGLALDLWNEVEIETSATTEVRYAGSGAPLLDGQENLTQTAMETLAAQFGRQLPPFTMMIKAEVPVARGLGSSAAAIVAGLFAADRLLGLACSKQDLFAVANRMEGHGDNVGAAIYGGAILAVPGVKDAIRLTDGPSLGLVSVVFIPDTTAMTWVARAQLPQVIPHADATFNLSTAAGLAVGLLTGNREAIAAGMHDRLHEPYRARLFPHLLPMMEAARAGGAIGACLSGAGPTVLALAEPAQAAQVQEVFAAKAKELGVAGDALTLAIAPRGAYLRDVG